jgi:hypothetical protein
MKNLVKTKTIQSEDYICTVGNDKDSLKNTFVFLDKGQNLTTEKKIF